MPRRGVVRRQQVNPDRRFGDLRVTRFINYVMLDGKKDKARKIVYGALETAAGKVGVEPVQVFNMAVEKVKPEVEVRPRRVGGATYQIPLPVPKSRSEALAMKWIIQAARSRTGKDMQARLAEELINAYNAEGDAVKKKDDTHRMAEANRAFAHFRW